MKKENEIIAVPLTIGAALYYDEDDNSMGEPDTMQEIEVDYE